MPGNTGLQVEHRVERAMAVLSKEKTTHKHGDRCLKLIKHIVTPGEETIMECKQSHFHSLSPTRIIATTRRIIVVRPSFWGLYLGHDLASPTEYSIIPYKHLISVIMSKGRLMSTLHMRIHGFTDTTSLMKDEGEIYGIRTPEAIKLARFLEEIIEYSGEDEKEEKRASELMGKGSQEAQNTKKVNLERSKFLIESGSSFVWLGVEPLGYVSTILGVDKSKVIKTDTSEITSAGPEALQKFRNCIFVGYDGIMSDRVSSYLKRNHGIDSYVLEGGITNVAHEYFTKIK
ncbi:MAG TPA: hypothetical protein VL945_02360 [Candidatus Saccharimonadales bacterium]|nr:hypothetical protein [Candidatus Saccharimonadales bacterium]